MAALGMDNLSALLKWSIENGHAEPHAGADGGAPAAQEITEERREFLMAAYNEYLVNHVDVLEEVTKRMQGLDTDGNKIPDAELVTIQEEALENMLTIVDSIDFARDFTAIGGLDPLLSLLESPHPSLRRGSAEVVATVVHNNPATQQLLLDHNVLPRLIAIVQDDADASVRSKALFAISSQVRNHAPSLAQFLHLDGCSVLSGVLRRHPAASEAKEVRRVLSLLPAIIAEIPDFVSTAREAGMLSLVAPRCLAAGVGDTLVVGAGDTKSDHAAQGYCFSYVREFAQTALVSLLEGADESRVRLLAEQPDFPRSVVEYMVVLGGYSGEDAETAGEETVRLRQLLGLLKSGGAKGQ